MDLIITDIDPPWTFSNRGTSREQGFEVEAKYDFGRGTYLGGNYTYANQKTGRKDEHHYVI